MKELMQALVVMILAVPFAYMAYDILIDLLKRSFEFYTLKARPVLITLINMMIK